MEITIDVNTPLRILTYIIGLIALVYGFLVFGRYKGKMKGLLIALILTVIALVAKKIAIIYISSDAITLTVNAWGDLLIAILLLIALYLMRKIEMSISNLVPVHHIRHHQRKKHRKQRR
ncbi:hypothetical protein KW805_02370 [Candidatus Pacearchaeota archaeon]|nr:hypothetical protein [Candidatus Pacearchaeota archaeon]